MRPITKTTKSRGGCTLCRLRRVKCDKRVPECANCSRRREKCEYSNWTVTTPSSVAKPRRTRAKERAMIGNTTLEMDKAYAIGLIKKPLRLLSISDLMLKLNAHHTFGTGLTHVRERELWKSVILSTGAKHDFLHHGLSSLICLLGESENIRTNQNNSAVYQQHLTALSSFRKASAIVDMSNWAAITLFACSVIIFEFGTQQICPDSVFDYMNTLHVLKMSAHVAGLVHPFLLRSELWQYIQNRVSAGPGPPKESLEAMLQLKLAIHSSHHVSRREREVLLEATKALEEWTVHCHGSPRFWEHYIRFPQSASADYFSLLAAKNDLALLILIHWCAVMHVGAKKWFLRHWPQRAAALAMASLSGEWTHLLAWPCSVFGYGLGRPSAIEQDGHPDPTSAGKTKSVMLGGVAEADPGLFDMGFVQEYC